MVTAALAPDRVHLVRRARDKDKLVRTRPNLAGVNDRDLTGDGAWARRTRTRGFQTKVDELKKRYCE
jgi:hypothetical protein